MKRITLCFLCACLVLSLLTSCRIDSARKNAETKASEETREQKDIQEDQEDTKLKEYLDQANELAEKGKYDEALALLDTAEQLCGASSQIDAARYAIEKAQLIDTVEQYEADGEIGEAILAIDSCKSNVKNDDEVVKKRNSLKKTFISQVTKEADAALKKDGYESAMAVIDEALKILPSEQAFLDKQVEYEEYKPVDLFSLEYFNAASNFDFEKKGPQVMKDNEGNTHYSAYEFKRDYHYGNTWVEYKLNKKYNVLSGTFFLDYDWRTTKEEARFYVYGDGKILYEGVQTGGKVPFDFSIDITNVDVLKIEYKTRIWTTSGFTHSVYAGIFDNTCIVKTK